MKINWKSLILLVTAQFLTPAVAADAIYTMTSQEPTSIAVENESLVVHMPVKKITVPKAKRIFLSGRDKAVGDGFSIQIDLAEAPPKELKTIVLVVGESTIMEGVQVGGSEQIGYSITLESKNRDQAREWFKRLKVLFGIMDKDAQDLIK